MEKSFCHHLLICDCIFFFIFAIIYLFILISTHCCTSYVLVLLETTFLFHFKLTSTTMLWNVDYYYFVNHILLFRFHVWEWFTFHPNRSNSFLEQDKVLPMLEGALSFLSTLLSIHTNIGMLFFSSS